MRRLVRILVLVATTAALLALPLPASARHIPVESEFEHTDNMHLVGFAPRANTIDPFTANSDLAFWRNLAFQGHYDGFRILDISRPSQPREIVFQECFGNQGDVVVWGDILIRSWNSPAPAGVTCDGQPVPEGFEGLHVFDISNLRDPVLVGAVETECGSHTATVAPDLKRKRLIVYNNVSSGCDWIDVIEVPLANPAGARLLRTEPLEGPFTPEVAPGCHDMGVIQGKVNLAACASADATNVFDIGRNRFPGGSLEDPEFLYTIREPGVGDLTQGSGRWHSASFTWDGKVIILGWEPGGGAAPRCTETGTVLPDGVVQTDTHKSAFFYDAATGAKLGQWVLPRPQTIEENCTIHNYNVVPLRKRYVLVSGNYQSGVSVVDFTNPAAAREFAYADPAVWSNGKRTLLFLTIDRTLAGPECGSPAVAHDDPNGWEGVRIFDVTNPRQPRFIKGVYTDCGAHTITLWPKNPAQILLYVSSYPLRPGPTCGQVRGPQAGRDPLHGVIQVIRVPVNNPTAAKEIAEPPVTYPGDPDNQFVYAEHGLAGEGLEPAARACHDISVFVPLRLAAAACAEQGQLWRVKANGLPDTTNPIWVFEDQVDETGTTGDPKDPGVVIDFFHSATFSWDGKVVNFIDESFGDGCPPTTPAPGATARFPGDTGRMFFLNTRTGRLLSSFMKDPRGETGYCSAHLGLPVASSKRLLVNAWYLGGVDVIDFNNPTRPREVAWYDIAPFGPAGGDNWSAYWYEGPSLGRGALTIYASDGVHDPAAVQAAGRGFDVFRVQKAVQEVRLRHLNPQTQELLIR